MTNSNNKKETQKKHTDKHKSRKHINIPTRY